MKQQRRFAEKQLVIATHNKGKLREITALFDGFDFTVIAADSLGLAEPEETETSFRGNALLKARAAAQASSLPALADDSGLAVAALDGAPGIYSARWAAPDGDFDKAMQRVHDELTCVGAKDFGATDLGATDLSAQFICALAVVWPDGDEVCVEGRVSGRISWPPRGNLGFGYDAIFQPDGYHQSFGEMAPQEKHAMSHRADAFAQLLQQVFTPSDAS
ncbi:MAG: RdgB/HAM1 family non-canonical purine NTP pyrophosphatase [Candidatus Puniceispirillaceae bacterium]